MQPTPPPQSAAALAFPAPRRRSEPVSPPETGTDGPIVGAPPAGLPPGVTEAPEGLVYEADGLVIPMLAGDVFWAPFCAPERRPVAVAVDAYGCWVEYRALPVGVDWRAHEADMRARLRQRLEADAAAQRAQLRLL